MTSSTSASGLRSGCSSIQLLSIWLSTPPPVKDPKCGQLSVENKISFQKRLQFSLMKKSCSSLKKTQSQARLASCQESYRTAGLLLQVPPPFQLQAHFVSCVFRLWLVSLSCFFLLKNTFTLLRPLPLRIQPGVRSSRSCKQKGLSHFQCVQKNEDMHVRRKPKK